MNIAINRPSLLVFKILAFIVFLADYFSLLKIPFSLSVTNIIPKLVVVSLHIAHCLHEITALVSLPAASAWPTHLLCIITGLISIAHNNAAMHLTSVPSHCSNLSEMQSNIALVLQHPLLLSQFPDLSFSHAQDLINRPFSSFLVLIIQIWLN